MEVKLAGEMGPRHKIIQILMQISGQVLQVLRLVPRLNEELEELDPKFAYLDYHMPIMSKRSVISSSNGSWGDLGVSRRFNFS